MSFARQAFRHETDINLGLDRISSNDITMVISRLGCEIVEITRHHPAFGDVPILWRNGVVKAPENGWANHATVLFPIVGRLKNMKSKTSDGIEVWFNRGHGFARESEFTLVMAEPCKYLDEDAFCLDYKLKAMDELISGFPWNFELNIKYVMQHTKIIQLIKIHNVGDCAMPFQVGWHPGFNAPFISGQKSVCHLDLPKGPGKIMLNNSECFLTGQSKEINLGQDFEFTEQELESTYMFDMSSVKPEDRVASLFDHDRKFGVKVFFPDYPHLGIWSNAGAAFLCIEPWQGMDDHVIQEPFDKKFGIIMLRPGQVDTRKAWIQVT
ncbi:MAG: hypothetical protein GXP49_14910 [Deltaproteobacteria bacterium]|nr:hypothetical protein [Deltaproteobacteria bacterium]